MRVYRGTCIAGYRLLFIGPCVVAGAVAERDAARAATAGPLRRSQEQASINSHANVRDLFEKPRLAVKRYDPIYYKIR